MTNHDWRTYCVTRLHNNPEVSAAEQMSFSRHNSLSASLSYLRKGENSNAQFQRALQETRLETAASLARKRRSAKKSGRKVVPKKRVSRRIADKSSPSNCIGKRKRSKVVRMNV